MPVKPALSETFSPDLIQNSGRERGVSTGGCRQPGTKNEGGGYHQLVSYRRKFEVSKNYSQILAREGGKAGEKYWLNTSWQVKIEKKTSEKKVTAPTRDSFWGKPGATVEGGPPIGAGITGR